MAVITVSKPPGEKLPKQCQQIMHGSYWRKGPNGFRVKAPITNQCPNAPVGWRDGMAFCKSHLHATYKKRSAKYAPAIYD